jgi:hypothetical protein
MASVNGVHESVFAHIGQQFIKHLPDIVGYLGEAQQAGVKVSPQAAAAVGFLELLASLFHFGVPPQPSIPAPPALPPVTTPPQPTPPQPPQSTDPTTDTFPTQPPHLDGFSIYHRSDLTPPAYVYVQHGAGPFPSSWTLIES